MPTKKPPRTAKPEKSRARICTLAVRLSGPFPETFAKENPVVSRTLQVRGDQTLADLHHALSEAFGRETDCVYEFQFGDDLKNPDGPRYVLPGAYEVSVAAGTPAAGRVDGTTLDALGLEVGRRFAYWIDCGDDWWHQIEVEKIEDKVPRGSYPKVTRSVGENPPISSSDEVEDGNGDHPLNNSEAADAACLVGELHLSKGDYPKAIEAFTRALEEHATADAYEGRAKAYRALAALDEKAAQQLR